MKRLALAFFVILMQATAYGQQTPGKPDANSELQQLAERYFNAIERHDAKTLDDLLLNECLVFYPRSAVATKGKLLEAMRKPVAANAAPATLTLSDVKVRRTGDTAVLSATLTMKHSGTPDLRYQRILTWTRQNDRWQILHDQWAMLGDAGEAEFWSSYFQGRNQNFNRKPNALLIQAVEGVQPGKALDAGMGEGRNAIGLAKLGWDVTGFDRAEGALAMARQQAKDQGLRITPVLQSDDEFDWGQERWDLVALLYFSAVRENAAKIRASLKPGGLVVIEAFVAGPSEPARGVDYKPGELRKLFQDGFEILRYEETEGVADYGLRRTQLVRLVAAKTPAGSCCQTSEPAARRPHARRSCRGR
jgi:ketosteroid isomerase-like protein